MKIIAHRGLSAKYPENTLLAFRKALEEGADGIETDLRLSSDDEVILFHDDDLEHITGLGGAPEALTLAALKKLDAGEGEKIPSLDELLQLTQGKATLILEIKYNSATYKRLCERVAEKIKDKPEWVEVSCFNDKVLEYMHQLDPRIKLHKIINSASVLEDEILERRYGYVSYFDVDVALRKHVLQKGLMQRHKVIFWVVSREDMRKEEEAGLYGIMVNDIGSENLI
ncbi:glycerophosphodiester phosphodiesterase family protein [Sulfurovum sp.]|uniref:glycerophosphodiester phosphodiesterase n=1 Tax=Sulfurovum sp. TaxID=1969726 RepID=UPI0025DC6C2C|nr:glycerophosphodiester phosphodiesterase family protein [Sulfurovum sp.]